MLTHEENELLCRVEGDAPMGQLMRRHWTPVCLIEEVSEPDGAPVKARVFGEDLVVFRDTDGNVGVMNEYCPHRRVSLVYGRNEDGGLRCLYHGWKMDVKGNVVEMVSEPSCSDMTKKTKHKAYETKEWGGFVWAYMGPQDAIPEFVPPAWAPTEETRVSIAKAILPCNWAQILEGAIDSAHSSSLHSSDFVPARVGGAEATSKNWLRPSTDKAPRMQVHRTSYGFRYAALRRPIQNAATHDYVRSTVFVAPATALIPPNNLYNVANINVPCDDTSTAFYFMAWGHADKTPETETWRKFLGQQVGIDLDAYYRPLRNHDNRFWQDREAMKAGNFTGIKGFPNQDIAMWVTMGAVADRTEERLGASDVAVVEFRRRMLDALKEFQSGEAAIGTGGKAIPRSVCSFQAMVPKDTDWKQYAAHPVWVEPAGEAAPELESNYQVQV
ncbi:ring-hydroxylating oxygenase subunit alpha [Burkholderia sp. SFA1]|uniref:Rieske 2Fe-2S domain-containing protein n=1 Tax=unclassified Caballeronia TaxID=2646786 RepID=UPI001F369AEF|nr:MULTISPECIES: Rieske 2Fe-2S domain-containing protein [unclassified Caballeronia]MCE4543980.1 Rieske 2Fe-2S domain-containing protein [Caballeronia sp. PC1]MCE4571131.1 Rieske 2Fe-2S domain-containing protein [Caballeronia sp. CLC5]BBP98952.1 ring-hydroxylating oxygenase subunit alpha [Burkholderia sp. SFA1]